MGSYAVVIRGMERFGARKETPLQTCLAEVEQCDIFIGIIACKAGSIDKLTGKSFVQREYEKAFELDKEILIYLTLQRYLITKVLDITLMICHTTKKPFNVGGKPCYQFREETNIFTRFQSLTLAKAILKVS